MQYLTRLHNRSIYLIAIGLFMLSACGKVEIVELAQTKQESFVRASSLTVGGQVINPETGEPIQGAVVATASFSAVTNADGNFKASLDSFSDSEAVTVTKDGHIVYEFGVNYTGLSDGATLNWEIYLPERETCIWIGPDEGAWYKFTANNTEYVVDVRRGSVDEWVQICVSQGGLAFGTGLNIAFGLPGLSVETPGLVGGTLFNLPLDIRFDVASVLRNYPNLPSNTVAGTGQIAAIGEEINAIVSNILYGTDFTGSGNPSSSLIINGNIPGNIIPGIGVIFNNVFYPFSVFLDPSTVIGDDGSIDTGVNGLDGGVILDDNSDEVENIPHQSIGDAGG